MGGFGGGPYDHPPRVRINGHSARQGCGQVGCAIVAILTAAEWQRPADVAWITSQLVVGRCYRDSHRTSQVSLQKEYVNRSPQDSSHMLERTDGQAML